MFLEEQAAAGHNLAVEEITGRDDVSQIAERWEALRARCGDTSPFTEFRWYWHALTTAARHKDPLVLIFRSHGEDVGLVPLVFQEIRKWGLSLNYVEFVDNPHTAYQRILHLNCLDAVLIELAGYLNVKWGCRYFLDLNELRLTEEERAVFSAPAVQKYFQMDWMEKPGSRYVLLGESFQALLQSLKKKTRKELRRKIRRLEAEGRVSLAMVEGDENVLAELDRFFSMYDRTWKSPETEPGFYQRLCLDLSRDGRLFFYALMLEGRPIAYLMCARGGDTIYGLKITYDVRVAEYSPGVILVHESIRSMYSIGGIRKFDIGRGDEQFKREWTSMAHRQDRLTLFPQCSLWRAVNVVRHGLLPRIKRNRGVNAVYGALRSRLFGSR